MYWYDSSGKYQFEDRDILDELSNQYETETVTEALGKAGYDLAVSVGRYGTASIDLFFSQGNAEFTGVALLWLGEGCECYVFRETHGAMVFMKEFSPMVAAVLQANSLAIAG